MSPFASLPEAFPPLTYIAILAWSLFWKGIALWKAAKYDQRNWFIVILVVNLVGILEIIYLFGFAKKKLKLSELRIWETKKQQ